MTRFFLIMSFAGRKRKARKTRSTWIEGLSGAKIFLIFLCFSFCVSGVINSKLYPLDFRDVSWTLFVNWLLNKNVIIFLRESFLKQISTRKAAFNWTLDLGHRQSMKVYVHKRKTLFCLLISFFSYVVLWIQIIYRIAGYVWGFWLWRGPRSCRSSRKARYSRRKGISRRRRRWGENDLSIWINQFGIHKVGLNNMFC